LSFPMTAADSARRADCLRCSRLRPSFTWSAQPSSSLCWRRSLRIQKDAALTDELTGALNRRGFFAAAEKLMALQAASGQPLSVLIFDLDIFKLINDRLGHAAGDETLKLFAGYGEPQHALLRHIRSFGRRGVRRRAAVLACRCGDGRAARAL